MRGKYNTHDNRGVILIFALMILGLLLASAAVVSGITLRSLQSTRAIRNSLQAWYAGTSGIEYGLANLRHERMRPEGLQEFGGALERQARYTLFVDEIERVTIPRISQNTSFPIDIFPHENELGATPVDRIRIQGSGIDGAWVEVRWVGWLENAAWVQNATEVLFSAAELAGGGRVVLLDQGLAFLEEDAPDGIFEPRAWRAQIIARYGDLTDIVVTAEDDTGRTHPIPAHLALTSRGRYQRNEQAVVARFPFQLPLSDLFNFVLFSDAPVRK